MNLLERLLPDVILSVGGTLVLIVSALRDDKNMRDFCRWLSLLFTVCAGVGLWFMRGGNPGSVDGWAVSGSINIGFSLVFMAILAWIIMAASLPEESSGEWYGLLLFAGVGMLTLARAGSLSAIFLGVETMSLSLYILIAFIYRKASALRGGLMYLILAGFASGFLAFGLALVYVVYGTLDVGEIQRAVARGPSMNALAMIGFSLFVAGVGFKLAVVPFHMWAADVYEAAPGAVSGLIASASKGATIAALLPFLFLMRTHWQILWLLAVASMIGGNLLGLRETRVKRILAYSSIAHIGYVLTGFMGSYNSATQSTVIFGQNSILFYVLAYAVAIFGAFVILSLIDRENDLTLRDLRGVGKRSPILAYCMLIFVWSLAGLPPAAGFFGKIYLFSAALNAGFKWLVILGLVGSAIGIFYYLRIIVHLFMLPADVAEVKINRTPFQDRVLIASAIATVLIGIFPDAIIKLFVP